MSKWTAGTFSSTTLGKNLTTGNPPIELTVKDAALTGTEEEGLDPETDMTAGTGTGLGPGIDMRGGTAIGLDLEIGIAGIGMIDEIGMQKYFQNR